MRKTEASAEMESGTVLGKAVFRASQALGLTGAELATVIGVSPASISRLISRLMTGTILCAANRLSLQRVWFVCSVRSMPSFTGTANQ